MNWVFAGNGHSHPQGPIMGDKSIGAYLNRGQSLPESFIKNRILSAHNQVRAQKRLAPLTWSDELTRYAKSWAMVQARNCQMRHSSSAKLQALNYGENLFWGSPVRWSDGRVEPQTIAPETVAQDWAAEETDYNYHTNRCRPGTMCGHYTQMVWHNTKQVGCAMALCPDAGQIWACNYFPAGNYVGERPY